MSDLVKYEAPSLAAIDPADLAGMSISLDQVKNPSGGGLAFEVPNGTDSPDLVKELTGVIVDQHAAATLWLSDQNDGKPGAYSPDGVIQVVSDEGRALCGANGWPQPTELLATCPYNQWPSEGGFDTSLIKGKPTKAKATTNQRRLYVLQSGEMLPVVVNVTPASLHSFSDFMLKRITLKGKKLHHVLTTISLEKVTKGGNTYSKMNFVLAGELPPEDAAAIDAFVPVIKQLTRRETAVAAEVPVAPVAAGSGSFEQAFDAKPVGADDDIPF